VPYTINGVGTSVCDGRGYVNWGGQADCDAVECFVILYLPFIPFRAVHTFQWNGVNYRQHEINWSLGLVVRAFAYRWLMLPAFIAVVLFFFAFSATFAPSGVLFQITLFLLGLALVVVVVLGYWLLWITDQRNRNLRRVLGPHELGSSDPATWRQDLLGVLGGPRKQFGTETYGAAVPILLEERRYASAMMAARLTHAVEDRAFGEELTDMILNDPEVHEALKVVVQNPGRWAEVMEARPQSSHANPPPPPPASDTTDITR
jgi:hypothetical protein